MLQINASLLENYLDGVNYILNKYDTPNVISSPGIDLEHHHREMAVCCFLSCIAIGNNIFRVGVCVNIVRESEQPL